MTDETFATSIQTTLKNLETSSNEFAKLTSKINNDRNVLSKIIDNERLGNSIDSTIVNLESGVKDLKELEAAAKNNFLLKSYFNKKKKEEKQKSIKK